MSNTRDIFDIAQTNNNSNSYKTDNSINTLKESRWESLLKNSTNNSSIDFVNRWGAMILGQNFTPSINSIQTSLQSVFNNDNEVIREIEFTQLISSMVDDSEVVRITKTETDAVTSAIRVARAYTKRDKVIKFRGCNHGISDEVLAGSMREEVCFHSDMFGISESAKQNTLIAEFNDVISVVRLFSENKGDIACVIISLVATDMGVIEVEKEFIEELTDICLRNGALLIVDETSTGFRLGTGGACREFGIEADLKIFGKIIGCGFSLGAYTGSSEIMSLAEPIHEGVSCYNTMINPVAISLGIDMLSILKNNTNIYTNINNLANYFAEELRNLTPCTVHQCGSLVSLYMSDKKIVNFNDVLSCNHKMYNELYTHLKRNNIKIPYSQYGAMYISNSISENDIRITAELVREFFESR